MGFLSNIFGGSRWWTELIPIIASIANDNRKMLFDLCVNTLEYKGIETHKAIWSEKAEDKLKAWQILIIQGHISFMNYINKNDDDIFWEALVTSIGGIDTQRAASYVNMEIDKRFTPLFLRYGHPEYHATGPEEGRGVNLVARDLLYFLTSSYNHKDIIVDTIQPVVMFTDISLWGKISTKFGDNESAEHYLQILEG